MNNSNVGGQQQRPQQQSGQFGTGQQQQTGQMTNITGMQMPGGQIRYQINSQPQPGINLNIRTPNRILLSLLYRFLQEWFMWFRM